MKKKSSRIIWAVFVMAIVAIGFALLFLKYSSVSSLVSIFKSIDVYFFVLSFIAYFILCLLRALRYSVISPVKSTFENFMISSAHIFINNLLPAEIGELTYPYLLKKFHNVSYSTSVSDLVFIRIFDGCNTILILLAVSLNVFWKLPIIYCIGAMVLGECLMVISYAFILKILAKYIGLSTVIPTTWSRKIGSFFQNLIHRQSLRHPLELFSLLFFSLIITMTMFLYSYLLMLALHVHISFLLFSLGWGLSMVFGSLPIQGFFGFGSIESGWVLSFLYGGLSATTALAVSVDYHVITLLYSAVFGCIALLYMSFRKKIVA